MVHANDAPPPGGGAADDSGEDPAALSEVAEGPPGEALGLLETTGFSPALVALDVMDKAAPITLLQAELNDFLGVCLKFQGSVAAVQAALRAGLEVAERMGGRPVGDVMLRAARESWPAIASPAEYNPLIEQKVVIWPPRSDELSQHSGSHSVSGEQLALGLIETQGFTAVFEAIDTACKAANVEVVAKEKLGGGYVTVIIRGDVAAVTAAVEAGRGKVQGLGTLIAAHVIARPAPAALALLSSL